MFSMFTGWVSIKGEHNEIMQTEGPNDVEVPVL